MSRGVGTPSRDLTSVVLCSSRMISMQSSTHSSQMNTVGPAMSLRTSCWDLPQNEQYRVFFESPDLLMPTPAPDSRGARGRLYPPWVAGDKDREMLPLPRCGEREKRLSRAGRDPPAPADPPRLRPPGRSHGFPL